MMCENRGIMMMNCVVFDVFSDFSLFKNQNCNLMFVFFNAQDKKAIFKIKIISRKNL